MLFRSNAIKLMYTDNAPELVAAVQKLRIKHNTSTPYKSTTNSIAERSIRTVLEGTRTILEHAGFPIQWWPYAARCFCFALNIILINGESAYNLRHQKGHFPGLHVPFGCLVDFRPPDIVLQKGAKFNKTSMPGLFLGYAQHVGGKWPKDYLVSPL